MAIKKTIRFSDKNEKIIKYFDKKFDEDEFNSFVIQLLTAYKDMKRKNIDLLFLSELIKSRPMNLDTLDIIGLIQNNEYVPVEKVTKNKQPSKPRKVTKNVEVETDKKEEYVNTNVDNYTIKQNENIDEVYDDDDNPILLMGDLSDD